MLLKKRKKLLSLLAALVMTLSISSVTLAAGFNIIEGDGVFRELDGFTLTTNRYETQIEADIHQDNMLFNLNIDYVSGNNLIRQISVDAANLTLDNSEYAGPGNYSIDSNGLIFAWVRATILTKGNSTPTYQEVVVVIGNNIDIGPALGVKDVIGILPVSDPETPLLLLAGSKSTVQFNRQNAQGGQNQQ